MCVAGASDLEDIHVYVCVFREASCELAHNTAMAQQGPIIVNEILCYIRGVRNMSTLRQIHEAVMSLFNMQKLHDSFLLYRDHR